MAIDIIRSGNMSHGYSELQRTSLPQQKRLVPGPFDVICARGKQAYNHQGNRFFRQIINDATEKYSKVESKLQRSMIVTDIVDAIREKGNGFLRQNNSGEWVACNDVMCREKVGQHFRNALGCRYKSSTKSKRKIKEQAVPRLVNSLNTIVFSSKAVTQITERLALDIIFIDESNDDAFYEKVLEANMNLLQEFKEDTCLVQQFRHKFNLGQHKELSSPAKISKPRSCGNALAA